MRIYAVADIHGRAERFELIRKKATETEADLIIIAGDMAGFFSQQQIPDQLRTLPAPVFYIRGNSDRRQIDRRLAKSSRVTHLHLRKIHYGGVCFGGISGTFMLPFESRLCLGERRFVSRFDNIFRDVSVLVTHPPPRGTVDKVIGRFHAGSRALRALAIKHQPALLICGHIHEHTGSVFLDRTLVINCSMAKGGAGALVEYRNGALPQARLLH